MSDGPLTASPPPETVLLTRRRWDAYCLPLFIFSVIWAPLLVWITGAWRFAMAPATVLAFWLTLRFLTPRAGMADRTIRSTPGAPRFLCLYAAAIVLFWTLTLIDSYVRGRPWQSPLEPYHAVLYAPVLLLLACAISAVSRAQRAARRDSRKAATTDGPAGTGPAG